MLEAMSQLAVDYLRERLPGWSKRAGKEEEAIAFETALETAVLFLSLALAVIVADYGWLGALGSWSSRKEANWHERLVYLFIAGIFTVAAAGAWYSLAFEVRPLFG